MLARSLNLKKKEGAPLKKQVGEPTAKRQKVEDEFAEETETDDAGPALGLKRGAIDEGAAHEGSGGEGKSAKKPKLEP